MPELQVWAFCGAQAQWREVLPSKDFLLDSVPNLEAQHPGIELHQQGNQDSLLEGSWGAVSRPESWYGSFVGAQVQ